MGGSGSAIAGLSGINPLKGQGTVPAPGRG